MDLDELRSVRRTERQKDSLQHLRDSFYADVADFVAERKAERKRLAQQADDPFSDPDVGRLTDEIETAEDVVEAIYERRVGKVVKLASFAAADMNADTGGLTAEERDLFEDLVARIKQNRTTVLDVLAGEGGSAGGSPATAADSTLDADATVDESTASAGDSPAPASEGRSESASAAGGDAPAPDDVLAEAMGGGASATEAASADAEAASDADPTVPPDAPPEAAAEETPVIGNGDDDSRSAGAPEAVRDGGVSADEGQSDPRAADPPTAGGDGQAAGSEGGSDTATDGRSESDTERVTLKITEDVGRIFGVDEREYDLASEDVVTLPSTNAGPLLDRDAAERLE